MIKEVIVVEGKNDSKRLKEFFDCETIETHGLGLNKNTLELIKEINDRLGVILFLDPDTPGEKIRKRINDAIPNLKNAFILKEDARTKKKVGVEHASKEVLEEALLNVVSYIDKKESLSYEEFIDLGLSGLKQSQTKRDIVSKKFHIGKCNSKTMFKRLNLLQVKKQDIEKIL